MELLIASANEVDPLKLAITDHRMFALRHGYISDKEPFVNHIKFNTQLRDCYHPWSASSVGHTYGIREYEKVISLKDYMTMPVDLTEDLLEAVVRGQADLAKLKKEAADKAARAAGGSTDPGKSAITNALREDKRHG
ncbi:hypothetical protein OBP_094 [Pseudomonas phage OBP]|uniref:hypothetical protein n=1 Tax=Pseudomonas phage OBP TaxID=1124849 RepID=UPI000240D43C|nr:hypothetical protein OBP_094 [Pseudomonas phage OBP]AEV89531.1 hypothetical protein OBP_094 [Pseudomonas phage OBP]